MAQAAIRLIKSDDDGRYHPEAVNAESAPTDVNAVLASAFINMEGGLNEITLMSEIASDLVDKLFTCARGEVGPHDYFIPDREREHAQFALTHLVAMIRRQKAAFDATL